MNIGANAMAAFTQGADVGRGISRNRKTKEINSLAAMGNLQGAAQKATEYGFHDHAAHFQQQITQLGAAERKAAVEAANYFGQVAGASLSLPEPQRRAFAAQQLQMRGYDPNLVNQVQGWDDASLGALRASSMDAVQQLEQANNVRDFKADQADKTRNFNLKAEDTRSDNSRADRLADNTIRLGDNTIRNTESQIADRDEKNALASRLADNTIANTQSQIADRQADNARADAEASKPKEAKPFSQAQATAAGFANRMAAAEENIAKAMEHFNPSSAAKGRGPLKNMPQRSYEAAQRAWIEAHLRKDSGAAIGKDEYENARKTYFPEAFDPPLVVRQKAQARAEAQRSMIAQSQGAYESMFEGPRPYPEGTIIENDAGDRLVMRGGQWVSP